MSYWQDKRVLVTGGAGFIGKTLVPKLEGLGSSIFVPRSKVFDLTKEKDVENVFNEFKPDIVIHLAADSGGIGYLKSNPGKVYFNNVMMNTLLMEASRQYGLGKFVTINSVNCYPENAKIPLKESFLWGGRPEKSVSGYGLSKRMVIYQSEAYRVQYNFNSVNLILDNVYGPSDNFNLSSARVIPALIRKCIEARDNSADNIVVWGTGTPKRSFLFVEDAVNGIILATEMYKGVDPVNIGSILEISIHDLTELIAEMVGYNGRIIWDSAKPDGQSRRCLDVSKAKKEFGFDAKIDLRDGLMKTIEWYNMRQKI